MPVAPGVTDEHRLKLLWIARRLGDPFIYTERRVLDRMAAFAEQAGEAAAMQRLRAGDLAVVHGGDLYIVGRAPVIRSIDRDQIPRRR